MKPDYKLVAKAKYIHLTADLAAELWQECYKKILPAQTAGCPDRQTAERRRHRGRY